MNAVAKLFLRKQGITNLKSLFKNIQQSHEQFSTVAEKNYAIGAQSAGLSFSISQETQELIDTAERFAKEEEDVFNEAAQSIIHDQESSPNETFAPEN